MTAALMAVWLPAALALASAAYSLAVIAACLKFRRRRQAPGTSLPPVSILKPVRGLDARFAENLRAHLEQDYPAFEVLVGAANADDPALAVGAQAGAKTFVCPGADYGNRKVAVLETLAEHARHDLLLVDDADIRPSPGWLTATVRSLQGEGVGLATCPYRANPGQTLGSKLDALWVSLEFAGQTLLAAELGGVSFALGATMLFRREDLERIGGFAALRPYLADDYQLGVRIAGLGKRTALSPSVVETMAGEPSLREVWQRHLRWSRTVRVSRPGGHLGLFFTFGVLWSGLLLAASGLQAPWAGLAVACLLIRGTAAVATARSIGAKLGWTWLLLPVADAWSAAVWAASFFGRSVVWRGRRLALDREGRIRTTQERRPS